MPRIARDENPFPAGATCNCPILQATVTVTKEDLSSGIAGTEEQARGMTVHIWLIPCACNENADPNGNWIKIYRSNQRRGYHVVPGEKVIGKHRELMKNRDANPQPCRSVEKNQHSDGIKRGVLVIHADGYTPDLDRVRNELSVIGYHLHVLGPILIGDVIADKFDRMLRRNDIGNILILVTPGWEHDNIMYELVAYTNMLRSSGLFAIIPVIMPGGDQSSLGPSLGMIMPLDCREGWNLGNLKSAITGERLRRPRLGGRIQQPPSR